MARSGFLESKIAIFREFRELFLMIFLRTEFRDLNRDFLLVPCPRVTGRRPSSAEARRTLSREENIDIDRIKFRKQEFPFMAFW